MKKIAIKSLLIYLAVFFTLSGYCQMQPDDSLKSFANRSLSFYLNNIINKDNFTSFGFDEYGETSKAELSEPYKIHYMGVEDLKKYEAGTDYKKIIMDAKKFWFPVMVNGEFRLRLEIIDKNGKLIAGEFGGSQSMKMMGKSSNRMNNMFANQKIEAEKVSIIQIPAMHVMLYYAKTSEGDFFIPALDMKHYNLEAGKLYSPEEIFGILKKFAKDIDPKIIR